MIIEVLVGVITVLFINIIIGAICINKYANNVHKNFERFKATNNTLNDLLKNQEKYTDELYAELDKLLTINTKLVQDKEKAMDIAKNSASLSKADKTMLLTLLS